MHLYKNIYTPHHTTYPNLLLSSPILYYTLFLHSLIFQGKKKNMELHLGLTLSSSSSSSASSCSSSQLNFNINESMKKRKHAGDEEDDYHVPQTLSLLVWNNNNNKNHLNDVDHEVDVDVDGDSEVQSNIFVRHRNDGGVIGWPPLGSCRKKLCHTIISDEGGGGQGDCKESKSTYVKVHMEGIGIARKVDLSLHHSYQTLVHTLANMFGKCYEDVKLTYQDKEGDWLLAGDVPWGSFIKTIQRLKLLRN